MASHIEMKALADNPAAVRSLATYLVDIPDMSWTDWEVDFLGNLAGHRGPEPITMRQREVLVELRDNAKSYSTFDGFSVRKLIDECWLDRDLLSEDDGDFFVRLKEGKATSLKRRHLLRLIRCARQLGHIEQYIAIDW